MPAAVDRVRVLEFSRDVRENLERLHGFVGFPVERFDRARDFETRTVAAAYLRQALEGILAIGRHILARRFRVPTTEYKQIAVELGARGVVPAELRELFVDVARYRNRLTHAYLEVTPEQLHGFVHRHLGDVERLLAALLSAAGLVPPRPPAGPDSSGPSEARERRVPYRGRGGRARRRKARREVVEVLLADTDLAEHLMDVGRIVATRGEKTCSSAQLRAAVRRRRPRP